MEELPTYMVPSAFVLLESLPLMPNGKIDRQALPVPGRTRSAAAETFVAPTLIEHYQLIQIWEELLEVRPIGIRDNFFSLGGHSLLAARLLTRIEQVFSKKILPGTLFAGPTIEQLANALGGRENTDSPAPVVTIQTGVSKQPFFFLHGDREGGSFYCFTLARDLGSDQPFYVLEPYRFDGSHVLPTFEALASAHVKSMRAIQSEGPYFLGGFCGGGAIAFEMAQQLRAEGQSVDLLALIEPGSAPSYARSARSFICRFSNLIRLGSDKQLDWFLRFLHVYRYLRYSHYRNLHRFSIVRSSEALHQDGEAIERWLTSGYVRRQYPGEVTFFWASENKGGGLRSLWGDVNKEGEVHVIPGRHFNLITDQLHILSAQLRKCLDKVQAAASN